MADNSNKYEVDPCGDFGPTQRWALVWFCAVLIGGSLFTYKLASTDRWMYDNNAQYLEMDSYKENRTAATTIIRDAGDSRAQGSYGVAKQRALAANSGN